MAFGRFLATTSSTLAVAGCAVLVVAMSGADNTAGKPAPQTTPSAAAEAPGPAGYVPLEVPSGSATSVGASTGAAASTSPTAHPTTPASVPNPVKPTAPAVTSVPHPRTSTRAPAPPPAPTVVRGVSLPVGGTTAGAAQVITVVASSYSSHTATLQAWKAAPGGGWLKVGPAVLAHVGSDGLSTAPSESKSATPIGSFTLTQAFGAYSDPGTALPYFQTTPADWWISQSGSLYNTHQHCSSGCSFTQGAPNEHLMYETPYYNYAVVIDYNTRNSATGVRQGAGSAFFLHVTDGSATAGCIAIPQSNLVSIMRWLSPGLHPRILIGVG